MYYGPTSIRINKQLKDFLQRRADSENRKLSQMIIHVLEMYRVSYRRKVDKPKVEPVNDQDASS